MRVLIIGLLLFTTFFFFSCMTTKKANKITNKFYEERSKYVINTTLPKFINFKPMMSFYSNANVNSRYKSFYTIPLIFYTFSKETIETKLNP